MTEAEKKVRDNLLAIAEGELKQTEDPPNSNMNKYGEWYGLNGVPWCAEFVSWVYFKSGWQLPIINTPKGFHYVPSIVNYAKTQKLITIEPEAGDIVCYDWDGNKLADHVGIFKAWIVKGASFIAIEGNTSLGNDSNGGEVMERRRDIYSVQVFIRFLHIS